MSSSKTILLFVIVSVSILGFCVAKDLPFSWEDCGKSERTFIIKNVDIEPKPLVFRSKTTFYLTGAIDAKEDMSDDVKVTLKITRVGSLWGAINIPVFYVKRSFCAFLKDPKLGPLFCSILSAAGRKCECPIPQGLYAVSKARTFIDIEALPSLLKVGIRKYGTGNWMIELWAYRGRREMGCFRLKSHLTAKL